MKSTIDNYPDGSTEAAKALIDGKPQAQMNRHFIIDVFIKSFHLFNKIVIRAKVIIWQARSKYFTP